MESFPRQVFITGIGTDVGKTIVSSVLRNALYADYWKPVQTGGEDYSDSNFIRSKIDNNSKGAIHTEAYIFKTPVSPLIASELENCPIIPSKIILPQTDNLLIIEGAGGALVHLTKKDFVIDMAKWWNIPVILVSRNYLGSINHTLLTIEALKNRGISILGIIYSGEDDTTMRKVISDEYEIPVLGSVDFSEEITDSFIAQQAEKMRISLSQYFKISNDIITKR